LAALASQRGAEDVAGRAARGAEAEAPAQEPRQPARGPARPSRQPAHRAPRRAAPAIAEHQRRVGAPARQAQDLLELGAGHAVVALHQYFVAVDLRGHGVGQAEPFLEQLVHVFRHLLVARGVEVPHRLQHGEGQDAVGVGRSGVGHGGG
jgi:hypothetical protein